MEVPKPPGTPPVREWWIALTYMSGAALVAAVLGVENTRIRLHIAELMLGAFLIGLGCWISLQMSISLHDRGLGLIEQRTTYKPQPSPGCLLPFVGMALIAHAVWEIAWRM